ncbi:TPA: RHS repeat protein [Citrobacter sedlakii]|nr:RHS repeat protein [Citrobacter sedlakii]
MASPTIQTIYAPGSFTLLVRIETDMAELAKAAHRTLAEKLQQDAGMTFVSELIAMLEGLERELRRGEISEFNLYHCDHRGLPLALIHRDGRTGWRAEYDEWGNVLREDNPDNLKQLIRLPGQQEDKETGLYYNRHRYLDPLQGRYITQDPIGLEGGWNLYQYPLNPVTEIDPLGLYQMCHRKFDPVPVPYARHCYIKFKDGTTSSFDNKGVHADPAPNKSGTICTEPRNPSLDECIREAMKKCKGKNYHFTEFNCCHCAEQAMKSRGTSIPKTSWPNAPINPGPQPGEPGYNQEPVFGSNLGEG